MIRTVGPTLINGVGGPAGCEERPEAYRNDLDGGPDANKGRGGTGRL